MTLVGLHSEAIAVLDVRGLKASTKWASCTNFYANVGELVATETERIWYHGVL